ncbi:MAG: hypothetical protein A2445_03725 [Candidatus Jacksonbacteria bacterium RIFOXYC2_FULL_44_29]|nr:MAG: hypothetical protein UV19_C0009G0002 [Parcubacteria group bacterium GW2011_GWA2_42_28]KKT53963.1 MAG: hypothetical protein UW45_C0021G0002 [Parcubacteria group bacterium GW2011_GWC2_44_22]OGY75561.1 MAG: hypothetical protein A2295_02540 [Candidatus Jacksonbacteria bacterium RIFOXYB2_FULL_44_15]OGY75871.1 MAG: hypothetical protein A2240_04535 [Candidatus Jacksonbacteria bacterium RIFOXYA2_FULL_43_12]OGY77211.1 MAG: hypothetical protein A2445_03725 [Candidatus Jacksonbacteria bacterium RI
MHLPNNLNLKPTNILKIAGLAIVAVVIVALAVRLVGSSFTSLVSKTGIDQGAPAFNGYGEMAFDKASGGAVGLSVRNVATPAVPPINGDTTVGDNAEEFEVTEYSANIETRQLENTCNEIVALKSRDDVIFENANKYEKSCNYSFKVKRKSVGEILTIIKALDPKELNENTYTIKQQIDDYTSEVEILEKKMSSIEETLSSAIKAYDDITLLATKTKDVESLAKIIDSKIGIIERLTQQRIDINAQLERLERSKTEQLDRLDYTYFNVYIVENKFIDGQNLKDSWIAAVKSFVGDINKVIQDITINLAGLLFLVLQYIIYFFIVLIIVKYGWKLTKRIWKK